MVLRRLSLAGEANGTCDCPWHRDCICCLWLVSCLNGDRRHDSWCYLSYGIHDLRGARLLKEDASPLASLYLMALALRDFHFDLLPGLLCPAEKLFIWLICRKIGDDTLLLIGGTATITIIQQDGDVAPSDHSRHLTRFSLKVSHLIQEFVQQWFMFLVVLEFAGSL